MKYLQTQQMNYLLLLFFALTVLSCQNATTQNDDKTSSETEMPDSDSLSSTDNSEVKTIPQKKYELPDWPIKAKTEEGKVYPFDEGKKDSTFVAFRLKLYEAVLEKDLEYLMSIISDDIKYSFGDPDGKEGFLLSTGLKDNPMESVIWKELAVCLELGGGFFDNPDYFAFYAPFVFMTDKIDDPYEEGVIIGDNVRLREGPGSTEKIIGSLSWDIVKTIYDENSTKEVIGGESHYWVNVKTSKGEVGYVYGKYFRVPIDYRAGFEKTNSGDWIMRTFIAGD